MRPRATHILVLLDYAVGTFLVLAVAVLVAGFFIVTGAPKDYEIQALGAAYTDLLYEVEDSARDLRADFCARADEGTAEEGKCEAAAAVTTAGK